MSHAGCVCVCGGGGVQATDLHRSQLVSHEPGGGEGDDEDDGDDEEHHGRLDVGVHVAVPRRAPSPLGQAGRLSHWGHAWVEGWIGRWMGGWMDGWMGGWMDRD